MSDPVSNSDIESVLSSVRRLVSESPDDGDGKDQGKDADLGDAFGPDKFVLTADFRVSGAKADAAPLSEDTPEADAMFVHANSAEASAEIDDETGEDLPGVNTLELTIAELEAVVGSQNEEWEPDGSEPDEETPHRMIRLGAASGGDSDVELAEITTPEPFLLSSSADQTEPRFVHTSESDETLIDTDQDDADPDEDALFDDEGLRALVEEIVRQELQGALGERITRNIRKLVRAEIKRALATREFE